MSTGIVFDIKEFAIHDGPGLRITVFLKGCPLRCAWCHNPEGISSHPQIMKTPVSERMLGKLYSSSDLAARLNKYADILRLNQGGVTFSGGEPLMQARFVSEVIDQLEDLHVLLDTSGYGDWDDFLLLALRCDLVYFDLKILDPVVFREYTGGEIHVVMHNLRALSDLGAPFVIRTPLIPGVTDTENNLASIAETIRRLPGLISWDLLPYNHMAGAKYPALGMQYQPRFDETVESCISQDFLTNLAVPWRVV